MYILQLMSFISGPWIVGCRADHRNKEFRCAVISVKPFPEVGGNSSVPVDCCHKRTPCQCTDCLATIYPQNHDTRCRCHSPRMGSSASPHCSTNCTPLEDKPILQLSTTPYSTTRKPSSGSNPQSTNVGFAVGVSMGLLILLAAFVFTLVVTRKKFSALSRCCITHSTDQYETALSPTANNNVYQTILDSDLQCATSPQYAEIENILPKNSPSQYEELESTSPRLRPPSTGQTTSRDEHPVYLDTDVYSTVYDAIEQETPSDPAYGDMTLIDNSLYS